MKGVLLFLTVLLFTCHCEREKKSKESFKSLFNTPCAYAKASKLPEGTDCYVLQFNPDYNVEALLETSTEDLNDPIIVPYLINFNTQKTQLTIEAQKKLGVKEDKEIIIFEKKVKIDTGEHNVLGFDFLKHTTLWLDFMSSLITGYSEKEKVAMTIDINEIDEYNINYPPAGFEELERMNTVEGIKERIEELKKDLEKLDTEKEKIRESVQKDIKKVKKYISKLEANKDKKVDL